MASIQSHHEAVLQGLLDTLARVTGLPIGLYEMHNGEPVGIFSAGSLAMFEPHCLLIQSFAGGKAACETSMCNRARIALTAAPEQLTACHAGLYNQSVPLRVRGEVRAVLLFGEMQVGDEEHQQISLQRHTEAAAQLNLADEQAAQLRRLLLQAKHYTPEKVEEFKAQLRKVGEWYYSSILDEEDRMRRNFEIILHEVQTQIQPIVANAENLAVEAAGLSPEEIQQQAGHILASAMGLSTVVQNLGEYLEDYHFRKEPIVPRLYEAKQIYEAEATRRGVTINIEVRETGPVQEVIVSRRHLQYALNNLVHNAVKYSFRGRPDRPRRVLIVGQPLGRHYKISVENFGIGILPQEITSGDIFRDGYQGKLAQSEYRTGSGKGLAFVQRVIERHHGYIRVESEQKSEDENPARSPHLNRFIVYLPYEQPEESTTHGEDHRLD